jgi:SAM-dependent methyltransferase
MDLATSFDVLYCLDEATEHRAVAEMHRVLRPGGVALVNVAALDVLRGSHSALTLEQRRYTRPRLGRLLADAGLIVTRMTYTNLSTFAPTLAVRTFDRLTGRAAVASDADLQVPPRLVNATLTAVLAGEAALLRHVNLPVGTSILCLAKKPDASRT